MLAGAEEQPVAVLWGHPVQELSQSLVAALPVACFPLVGVSLAAGGNVSRALFLAGAVEVAGFGGIQTGVAVFVSVGTLEAFWGHSVHP